MSAATTQELRKRLEAMAEGHEMSAKFPVDVSGSDRLRALAARDHIQAADDIRAALKLMPIALPPKE